MDRNIPVPFKLMNSGAIHGGSLSNWLGPEPVAEFATEQVLSEEVEESERGLGATIATSKGTNAQGMSGQEDVAIRRNISLREEIRRSFSLRAELEVKIQGMTQEVNENSATPRVPTQLPAPFYSFVQEPAYVHTMPQSKSPPPALQRPRISQLPRDVGRLGSRSLTPKATSKSHPPPLPPPKSSSVPFSAACDFPPPPKPPPQGASAEQLACGGWPSLGSVGHPDNCAGGCKYHTKTKGCKDGVFCKYCHICGWRRYGKNREQRVDPMYLKFLETMARKALEGDSLNSEASL